jgi:predicted HAD superfamily Cof-like phosphohydrolase
MYGLAVNEVPTVLYSNRMHLAQRLKDFKKIMIDEINEVDQIIADIEMGHVVPTGVLTDIADWLGDIQVYCASEMLKFGLDREMVLSIIMASNMSKLGEDGQPIYDETGKVLKGPNYWKPEPMIARYIEAAIRQWEKQNQADANKGTGS